MEKRIAIKLFTLIFCLTCFSCKLTLIPDFDASLLEHIEKTAKEVDRFYLSMLEMTSEENSGRAYEKFQQDYIQIEVELNFLLNKNRVRPLNENSTRICEITLGLWQKYKEEHKADDTLSDGLVKLNRMTFDDLFFAMRVAEKAKDIVNDPPS